MYGPWSDARQQLRRARTFSLKRRDNPSSKRQTPGRRIRAMYTNVHEHQRYPRNCVWQYETQLRDRNPRRIYKYFQSLSEETLPQIGRITLCLKVSGQWKAWARHARHAVCGIRGNVELNSPPVGTTTTNKSTRERCY